MAAVYRLVRSIPPRVVLTLGRDGEFLPMRYIGLHEGFFCATHPPPLVTLPIDGDLHTQETLNTNLKPLKREGK